MSDAKIIGYVLKQRRDFVGLTIKQLSDKSGVSTGTISQIETGLQEGPSLFTLQRLAVALGRPLSSIIAEWEFHNKPTKKARAAIVKAEGRDG